MPNKGKEAKKAAKAGKRPTMRKDTVVTYNPGGGQAPYGIKVKKGSPYAKQAKKLGSVTPGFRAGSFTQKTDPFAAGISPGEKKKRMASYGTKSTYKKSSRVPSKKKGR